MAAAAAEVTAVGGAVALPRTFALRLRFACFQGSGGEELLRGGGGVMNEKVNMLCCHGYSLVREVAGFICLLVMDAVASPRGDVKHA